MQHIASALGALDHPARARVLHWAAQRFQGEQPLAPPAPPEAVTPPRAAPEPDAPVDEALSVSMLDEMFNSSEPPQPAQAADAPAQPIAGLLHDFVVEFQSIARDWSVASAAPSDETRAQRASSGV